MQFNSEQQDIITDTSRVLRVIAGAGTGKTTTLIGKLATYLATGTHPTQICLVTFSKKTTMEIKQRIQQQLPTSQGLAILTFHSFCFKLLKQFQVLQNKTLYEEFDFAILTRNRLKEIPTYKDFLKFLNSTNKRTLKELLQIDAPVYVSAVKAFVFNHLYDEQLIFHPLTEKYYWLDQIQCYLEQRFDFSQTISDKYKLTDELAEKIIMRMAHLCYEFLIFYNQLLEQENKFDFDTLLLMFITFLETNEQTALQISEHFRYFCVDEFQDTNYVQMKIIQLLDRSPFEQLCLVGDIDQCIYRFRGAHPEIFYNLENYFPDCQTKFLTANYRSSKNIVSLSNRFANLSMPKFPKNLQAMQQTANHHIQLSIYDDEAHEARHIIQTLQNAMYHPAHTAILFRSNAQAAAIEHACLEANIPYLIVNQDSYFNQQETRVLLSYVTFAHDWRNDDACEMMLKYPSKFLRHQTIDTLKTYARQQQQPLFSILKKLPSACNLQAREQQIISRFTKQCEQFLKTTQTATRWIDILDLSDDYFNVSQWLAQLAQKQNKQSEDEYAMFTSLRQFIKDFQLQHPTSSLENLLLEIMHLRQAYEKNKTDRFYDSLKLMTVHAAKGLEFNHVFFVGLNFYEYSKEAFAEERCIHYVAITRAKQNLHISCQIPSYFFRQFESLLPDNTIDYRMNKNEEKASKH
ncbi:MAG: ATP-dependent helicase [Culicoidibacterales bacterium]